MVRNQQMLEQLKQQTANEMGIELSGDTPSRLNGAVGGKMTQKLVELGALSLEQNHMPREQYSQQSYNQFQQ